MTARPASAAALLSALAAFAALAAPPPATPLDRAFAGLDATLEQGIRENGISGASLVVVSKRKVVHRTTAGLAEPAAKT